MIGTKDWPLADFAQLEQALNVSEQDVKDASAGVLKDLKRFQLEKEDDLKRYMVMPCLSLRSCLY